jgi:hypothetical protein
MRAERGSNAGGRRRTLRTCQLCYAWSSVTCSLFGCCPLLDERGSPSPGPCSRGASARSRPGSRETKMRFVSPGPGSRGASSAAAAARSSVYEIINAATKQLLCTSMHYRHKQPNRGVLHGRRLASGSLRPRGEGNQTGY